MRFPIPTDNEPEPVAEPESIPVRDQSRIRWYLDCENWKCPECGSNVFGRCKSCPYCKGRLRKDTPRPAWYIEN